MVQLQQHLQTLRQLAHDNLIQAQEIQKKRYDHGTQEWSFQLGEQVLVSSQAMANPMGDPWQGPFTVT